MFCWLNALFRQISLDNIKSPVLWCFGLNAILCCAINMMAIKLLIHAISRAKVLWQCCGIAGNNGLSTERLWLINRYSYIYTKFVGRGTLTLYRWWHLTHIQCMNDDVCVCVYFCVFAYIYVASRVVFVCICWNGIFRTFVLINVSCKCSSINIENR